MSNKKKEFRTAIKKKQIKLHLQTVKSLFKFIDNENYTLESVSKFKMCYQVCRCFQIRIIRLLIYSVPLEKSTKQR